VAELRADARRNRGELLDVARQVIAEEGVDASLRDIARRAGVGIGTLYRHFPTREALLAGIIGDGTRRMAEQAAELSAAEPPGDALSLWLTAVAMRIGPYNGLAHSMLDAVTGDGAADEPLRVACEAMMVAGRDLLGQAQAAEAVRADVTWDDVFTAIAAISGIAGQPGAPGREAAARVLAVYLDGLATVPGGDSAPETASGLVTDSTPEPPGGPATDSTLRAE
jgi:AcrR family transcriptional regulator